MRRTTFLAVCAAAASGLALTAATAPAAPQDQTGPFTSMLLAQAGAQVIKLEPPKTGERLRRGASVPNDIGERAPVNFIALNRGKLGVTLDLRAPQGKDAFKKLVAVSDVSFSLNRGVFRLDR